MVASGLRQALPDAEAVIAAWEQSASGDEDEQAPESMLPQPETQQLLFSDTQQPVPETQQPMFETQMPIFETQMPLQPDTQQPALSLPMPDLSQQPGPSQPQHSQQMPGRLQPGGPRSSPALSTQAAGTSLHASSRPLHAQGLRDLLMSRFGALNAAQPAKSSAPSKPALTR